MPESSAASRLASWIRCSFAFCGSTWVSIVYGLSLLQFSATLCLAPGVRVDVPDQVVVPESLLPQAASSEHTEARLR